MKTALAILILALPVLADEPSELERLRAENAMLRQQVTAQEVELAELRQKVAATAQDAPQLTPAAKTANDAPKPLTMAEVLQHARRYAANVPGETSAARAERQKAALDAVQGKTITIRGKLVDVKRSRSGLVATVLYESSQQVVVRPANPTYRKYNPDMAPAERLTARVAAEGLDVTAGTHVTIQLQADRLTVTVEGAANALRVDVSGSKGVIQ